MNSATVPTWVAPWSKGLVYGQRVFKPSPQKYGPHDRARHRPRLTIYTYGHDNTPILSWSDAEPRDGSNQVHFESTKLQSPPPELRWERVPRERNPWNMDISVPVLESPVYQPGPYDEDSSFDDDVPDVGHDRDAGLHPWGSALRGWAAGAMLLALIIVMARAVERCIDWRFMRRRRRMQQDWQRANARALNDAEGLFPSAFTERSAHYPPPYSDCTTTVPVPKPPTAVEDQPPPYSNSCVQLVNKNGVPVIIYSRNLRSGIQDGRDLEINQDIEIPLENTEDEVAERIASTTEEGNTTIALIETVPIDDEIIQIEDLPFMPPPDEFTDSDENTDPTINDAALTEPISDGQVVIDIAIVDGGKETDETLKEEPVIA